VKAEFGEIDSGKEGFSFSTDRRRLQGKPAFTHVHSLAFLEESH